VTQNGAESRNQPSATTASKSHRGFWNLSAIVRKSESEQDGVREAVAMR
jgi:hypothetical protein